ncbi:MAG: hypothetical protein COT19_02315 [Gallionellales bacterium CG08_land_8_20_14_0_20_59_87]|nr:MAG: hypothetical protein COT19_02315 [Gallionellales bacterium CG08_land_8_20_14_0_20_59_87]
MQKTCTRIARQPELNLFVFAFLLNLPWELLQIPLFRQMTTLPHLDGTLLCLRAAAGDGVILLLAYWMASWVAGSRRWIERPSVRNWVAFIGAGLAITIAMEYWATVVAERWDYADAMPRLPLLGTGLAPLLQWILIPPLVLWLTQRQLK